MINDRDMYYGGYNYGGFAPLPNGNQTLPFQNMSGNNYMESTYNDINERINRLERQVKRLDQRLTRLETPYLNTNQNYNTGEPDNNMYMM